MLNPQVIGIVGLIAIAECWLLAVVLFRAGMPGSVARMLALVLVVEGVTLATAGFPEFALAVPDSWYEQHPWAGMISFILHTLGDSAMVAFYLPFLAAALNTRLTRPFAGKRGRIGAALAATVMFLTVMFTPQEFAATVLYLALILLFGFALVASIHAWLVAAPGIARTRAKLFAAAFGLRDVCWGFVYMASIWWIWDGTYFQSEAEPPMLWEIKLIYALGTLIAIPIIAYGVLRTQLFDIDLKIRWTIKQSALGFAAVSIIYVLSEGAEMLLSEQFGTAGGLVGAAIVVILLQPLKRLADRVASAAMPNTNNTPEYTSGRKLQVYESAYAEALAEGGISQKERNLLDHLRESLGIPPSEAEAIESQLQSGNLSYG